LGKMQNRLNNNSTFERMEMNRGKFGA